MTQRPGHHAAPAKRSLVTGGAGFIGSHLVESLIARGDAVTVVDDCSTGSLDNLACVGLDHERLTVLEMTVSGALAGPLADAEPFDEIFHLAASVGVMRILDRPTESIETNIHETSALLAYACRDASGRRPTVLLASSSEVYGLGGHGEPLREDDRCTYGPTTAHRWSYGYSKAIDEFLALAHAREHGLPVVIARFFNIVGPRQAGEYGMVLPRFVSAAMRDEPLTIFGDGTQVRTFCDVRDAVGAMNELMSETAAHGRVVNLGSDRPISVSNLAQRVIESLKSGSETRTIPYHEAYPEGFEDLPHRCPDLARLKALCGFEQSIPLEQTIRDIADSLGQGRETATRRAAPARTKP